VGYGSRSGSRSCSFLQCLSRCNRQNVFSQRFFHISYGPGIFLYVYFILSADLDVRRGPWARGWATGGGGTRPAPGSEPAAPPARRRHRTRPPSRGPATPTQCWCS